MYTHSIDEYIYIYIYIYIARAHERKRDTPSPCWSLLQEYDVKTFTNSGIAHHGIFSFFSFSFFLFFSCLLLGFFFSSSPRYFFFDYLVPPFFCYRSLLHRHFFLFLFSFFFFFLSRSLLHRLLHALGRDCGCLLAHRGADGRLACRALSCWSWAHRCVCVFISLTD